MFVTNLFLFCLIVCLFFGVVFNSRNVLLVPRGDIFSGEKQGGF